jgi:hypothetical protein
VRGVRRTRRRCMKTCFVTIHGTRARGICWASLPSGWQHQDIAFPKSAHIPPPVYGRKELPPSAEPMSGGLKLRVIASNAKVCLMILAAGIAGFSSCRDPVVGHRVRTIRYHVTVRVLGDRGLPVSDVKVSMKESWQSWKSRGSGGNAKSEEPFFRQRWASDFVPCYESVTDAQGEATIRIENTAMDQTTGSTPPANRDIVSNREFIVKLEGEKVQEQMLLVIEPGAIGNGKSCTIEIEAIEKPKYVP